MKKYIQILGIMFLLIIVATPFMANDTDSKYVVNKINQYKGEEIMSSIIYRLGVELNTTFGWSVNDLPLFISFYLDNRKNRQKGVIFATRMLQKFYSINLSKLGNADPENKYLKAAREKYFAFDETSWGMFFAYSAESQYKKGLKSIHDYLHDYKNNKAVFNMKTDDIYNLLKFINGREFLDQIIGQINIPKEKASFFDIDDRIEYAKGSMIVLRDVLNAIVQLYPEVLKKGGEENYYKAVAEINSIIQFNPLLYVMGDTDSLLADHLANVSKSLIQVEKRIDDIADSLNR